MRIFVAGATGAVGRRLVPLLVAGGHEVTGTTRTPGKVEAIRRAGASAVLMDGLDPRRVAEAVAEAAPDVVVHELTAIPQQFDLRRFEAAFAETDRLRTGGTDHLIAAARSNGARKFVAQSYAAWPYARVGGPIKSEDDPFDEHPPAAMRRTLGALRHLESAVLGEDAMQGVVLRYGAFYGPGSPIGEGGSILEAVRRRRMPIVGSGAGVFSFVHLDDVAAGTALAIDADVSGVYNITDGEPAPVREWLPALAAAIGAPTPRRVPAWLAKPLIGEVGVTMMTEIRGASNAKATHELGWRPRFTSWREGFRAGLGEDRRTAA